MNRNKNAENFLSLGSYSISKVDSKERMIVNAKHRHIRSRWIWKRGT